MSTGDRAHTGMVVRAGVWKLDPTTADIGFSARGLWGLLPVCGRFRRASGSITWSQDGTATVLLERHAASVTTGMGMRDRHLCGPEFLDARTHPVISFHGHAVSRGRTRLEVQGKLTVRDATTEMQLDVELAPDGPELVAATAARVDLSAYGIGPRFGIVRRNIDLEIRGRLIPAATSMLTPRMQPTRTDDGVLDLGAQHNTER
ncbi:YceI family protein [Nocardia vinacea]|uniref:YceI family protein n=1 Tax=Nocardia vinacea TaxID=96468 RepID=UPI0033D000A8